MFRERILVYAIMMRRDNLQQFASSTLCLTIGFLEMLLAGKDIIIDNGTRRHTLMKSTNIFASTK